MKVRTGVQEDFVWALLHDGWTPAREDEALRRTSAMRRTIPEALDEGHRPRLVLHDGYEVLCACERCEALGFIDAVPDGLVGGELFDEACDGRGPPRSSQRGLSLS